MTRDNSGQTFVGFLGNAADGATQQLLTPRD